MSYAANIKLYNPGLAPIAHPVPTPAGPHAYFPEPRAKREKRKIALPTMEGFCFEKIKNILYLEASGNYTLLHFTGGRQVLVCKTLRDVEALLPTGRFIRIHRSHAIHLRHLTRYTRGKGGQVELEGGIILVVSAGQKEVLLAAVEKGV